MPRRPSIRRLFSAGLAVVLTPVLFCAVPAVSSRAALSPVKTDGLAEEWTDTDFIVDARSGAEIGFQNDGRNLYILLRLKGADPLMSAASTGMTVLGRAGKTGKPANGVLFMERELSAENYIRWQEGQGGFLTEAERSKVREIPLHPVLLCYAIDSNGRTFGPLRRKKDVEPPAFAVSHEAAGSTYELRLPLESPALVPGGIGAPPGEVVRLQFKWGGAGKASLSTKATRETPPSEKGEMAGSGGIWGQELLFAFDSLSRPARETKKFSVVVDVKLAEPK